MHRPQVAVAPLLVAVAILACASPLTSPTIVPPATGVALTLQAMASATAASATAAFASAGTSQSLPTPISANLLPHALYFLGQDEGGLLQVFRLDADGRTNHQITFEPIQVDSYDVSPSDGNIAYSSNNQLFVVDANGAGRRMLLDGGPLDENNRWMNTVGAPVWSPDGQTLAYSHGGLNFLSLSTGASSRVLENKVDTSPGFAVVSELYAPVSYSPDGSRLLISITFNEGGTYAIYDPANAQVLRLQRNEGGIVCCHPTWTPDGRGLYLTSPSMGMVESGLHFADAASGSVTTVLPGAVPDGTYNFADAVQVGPDGKLYFFFNNLPQIPPGDHTPLFMVRSDSDGVTGRKQLLPQAFNNLNEILWASDASLAIVVVTSGANADAAGQARILYPDGRATVTLLQSAQNLRWGP